MSKVLIVEDDQFISKIMKFDLRQAGYEVGYAKNGEEAINQINANGYSLILLDLMMPRKDGFEVLKELKNQGSKIPVIVFTNLAQTEDRQEVLALGAKAYFIKSDISIDELVEAIKKYL